MSYYLSLFADNKSALQYIDESQNPISKSPLDDIIQLDGGIKKDIQNVCWTLVNGKGTTHATKQK